MWVLVALAAGTLQTARNGLGRSLSGEVPPVVLTWARFAFNLPFALALVAVLWLASGEVPTISGRFLLYCFGAGVFQMTANVALMASFRLATFAQAIVIHKSEVALTAVVGAILFSELPSVLGWVGVAVTAAGVVMISLAGNGPTATWRDLIDANRGSGLALLCALLLVAASFAVSEATAALITANPAAEGTFGLAAATLFHVTWMEVVILTGWLAAARPELLRLAVGSRHRRRLAAIGFTSFAGSLCWFWAFTLTLVAYVRAVGQVEAVLSVLLAIYLWHEHRARRQLPGIAVTIVGIMMIVLG